MTPATDRLEALLEPTGLEPGVRLHLARYAALLLEANRRFNLTGAKSAEELAPHLIDSLSIVPYVREPYVDVGSGGGLPAIPVAIVTGAPITMIEAKGKKARFLESALERLLLRGFVVTERAESAAHKGQFRERFISGTARGVGSAPTVAELLLPFIQPGGIAMLQRGQLDAPERAALEDASLMLGGRVETETKLAGERRIIVVRKDRVTPTRFPRRTGLPEKRPLCST